MITSNFSTTKTKQIFTQNDLVSNRKTASCTLEDAQSFADGKFLVLVASKGSYLITLWRCKPAVKLESYLCSAAKLKLQT